MSKPLTLAGIGHRQDRLDAGGVSHLRHRVRGVLTALVHGDPQPSESDAATSPRLVTALADGSDTIIATAALECGLELVAVLPTTVEDYLPTFPDDEARQTLKNLLAVATLVQHPKSPPHTPEMGYVNSAAAILDRSDLVIAIWDGEPGRGPGGTADSIARSRAQGLPVIWIPLSADVPISVLEGSCSTPTAWETDAVHRLIQETRAASSRKTV